MRILRFFQHLFSNKAKELHWFFIKQQVLFNVLMVVALIIAVCVFLFLPLLFWTVTVPNHGLADSIEYFPVFAWSAIISTSLYPLAAIAAFCYWIGKNVRVAWKQSAPPKSVKQRKRK